MESLINRHAPPEHRARDFGYYAFTVALGIALGTLLGVPLYPVAPRAAFVLGGCINLIAAGIMQGWLRWPHLEDERQEKRAPLVLNRHFLSFGSAWSQGCLEGAMVALLPVYLLAIWLAETRLSLGKSLKDVLDVSGESPSLALLERVRDSIDALGPRERARTRAEQALSTVEDSLRASDWWHERWLDDVLDQVALAFDQACERWRGLYSAALAQAQDGIIRDAARSSDDKRQAERLRREAARRDYKVVLRADGALGVDDHRLAL